jgi:hypothetical protein
MISDNIFVNHRCLVTTTQRNRSQGAAVDDGHIESGTNAVERSIRGLALNKKSALFAGHDPGAENWARIRSFVETCKLNAVDPLAG